MARTCTKVKPKSPTPFSVKTAGMELKLLKNTAKDIIGKPLETSGGKIDMPSSLSDLFPGEDPTLLEQQTMSLQVTDWS